VVFALSWSRPFVVPLLLGIVIAYTLNPVVVWLEAIIVPVGTFIATWMTGRIARMNSAAIFVSLLFWGWLWGVWGVLLGIPIIVIVKVVSEHVEQLQPVDELLGH
jgi:predicted PurR-regulated permease PerM